MRLLYIVYVSIAFVSFLPSAVAEDYMDAVFVALSNSLNKIADPVKFDREEVDVRGAYDIKSSRFYAAKTGDYWVSLSSGAHVQKSLSHYLFRDSTHVGATFRSSGSHNGTDSVSRDIIVPMKAMQSIHTYCHYSNGLYSDEGLQTSLSLFRLTDLMSTTVVFSAARTNTLSGSAGDTVTFPSVFVNEGDAFQTSTFKAPKAGLYFFSYSAGLYSGQKTDLVLKRNVITISSLERYYTGYSSYDTFSRSSLCYLNKGDMVYVSFNISSTIYGVNDQMWLVSFSGFLYEPVHGHSVAWSVAKTGNWSDNTWSILTFDEVLVNEGNNWDQNGNFFLPSITGIYYITFSVGVQPYQRVHVTLVVDFMVKKLVLNRDSTWHSGVDMMSRSAVVFLEAGKRVYLMVAGNTAIYSSQEKQTSFTGLLLFPTNRPKL